MYQTQIMVGNSRCPVWIVDDTCMTDIAQDTMVSDEIGSVFADRGLDFFSQKGISCGAYHLEVCGPCGVFLPGSAGNDDGASVTLEECLDFVDVGFDASEEVGIVGYHEDGLW